MDAPRLPYAWECGFLTEESTSTLMCGDLFTQGGADLPAITELDIFGPSEAFRHAMDYFSHTRNAAAMLEKLAATMPVTLACMHGVATVRNCCVPLPGRDRGNVGLTWRRNMP